MKNNKLLSVIICLGAIATFAIGCRTTQSMSHEVKTVYNVRKFGATGDGKTLDNGAINKAIDAAAEAGGGTVLVPAGTYLCGSIHLKSNIHLVIDTGASILGAPQSMMAYDAEENFQGPAFQDGGHTYFHNSLIWGENITNVFITGHGMISGGGLSTGDGIEDRMDGFNNFGKTNTAITGPGTTPWPQHLGNKSIALKLCRNVLIRDITIFHGGHFCILVTGCDDMTIDNVTIDTERDGMDIDCCKNTMVSNCRVNSPGDDGICPKSTYALGKPVIEDNLTIMNCQVSGFQVGTLLDGTMIPRPNGNGRIKFGTESSGGFRNVTIANCTFRSCRGLALEEVDGGIMENVSINNITMMDVPHYGIYITTGRRDRTPDLTTNSVMKNIFISNVIIDNVGLAGNQGAVQITGMPGAPIENLRLDNIRVNSVGGGTTEQADSTTKELNRGYPEPGQTLPAYGVYARHVKGLELDNISTTFEKTDMRPAMVCSDVDGLDIDNFKAQVADGVAPAKFDGVTGLTILNSPVLQK